MQGEIAETQGRKKVTDAAGDAHEGPTETVGEKVMEKGLFFLWDVPGRTAKFELKSVVHVVGKQGKKSG